MEAASTPSIWEDSETAAFSEIEMLENKIVYMQNVYDLIKKYYEDPKEEV